MSHRLTIVIEVPDHVDPTRVDPQVLAEEHLDTDQADYVVELVSAEWGDMMPELAD